MPNFKLTGKSFLTILLYSSTTSRPTEFNQEISGRTRITKMGYLFKMEFLDKFMHDVDPSLIEFPSFEPWHYGPFSIDMMNDLEFLINQGYIDVKRETNAATAEEIAEYVYWIEEDSPYDSSIYLEPIYALAESKGLLKGQQFWNDLSVNQRNIIIEFKSSLVSAPLNRILSYLYTKYENSGQLDKSLIKDKYLH